MTRPATRRIAMWSGPRNISTAMMRAFENRADTAVWDEPFYGHYLAATGIDHPMRAEIMAASDGDWEAIVARCLGPVPGDAVVFYQKHMAHHMPADADLAWLGELDNCFLIRDPAAVALSYARKRDVVTAADLGFRRQAEIFDAAARVAGRTPTVLDAADVLDAPEAMLRALCARLDLGFDAAMLAWPTGRRDSDGLWGRHWYGAVEASTGFAPPPPPPAREIELAEDLRAVVAECRPFHQHLAAHRLKP